MSDNLFTILLFMILSLIGFLWFKMSFMWKDVMLEQNELRKDLWNKVHEVYLKTFKPDETPIKSPTLKQMADRIQLFRANEIP